MADTTWADGQLFAASRQYIQNRNAAKEALNKAAGAYQSVIQSTDNARLKGRARLGLARVYEMQGDLEKARAMYQQVTGPYAEFAKAQAERLAKPEAKETYDWLASAQPPAPPPAMGPGTPGKKPEFSPNDITLPGATGAENPTSGESKGSTPSFDELLKSTQGETKQGETGDRYKTETTPGQTNPATPGPTAGPESKGTQSKPAEPPAKSEAPQGNDKNGESSPAKAPGDKSDK
jgi:tetratricopeptide (TPR) repeat protein